MEIKDLENKILYLEKRLEILEKKERRRTSLKYLKIIIKILLICVIIFVLWKSYDYIVNGIPNIINEKIKSVIPF